MSKLMKLSTALIFLLILSLSKVAAQDYPANIIPDSLTKNANSVIRDYSATFTQTSVSNATFEVKKVITILNKKGDSFANFWTYEDKFRSLANFNGTVRDASGKILRKIKKSDLTTSSISMGALATDNVTVMYECQHPSYPFTVEYSYQIKIKNGIIAYPSFDPVDGYAQSVEAAHYTIELPADVELRHKSFGCELSKKTDASGKNLYSMSVNKSKAIGYEPYAPPAENVFPTVYLSPISFCYDSQCGDMSDWKNYGLWAYKLVKNRDVISPELTNKLKELTKDAVNDRETVKIVYDFLQNNTRYVSIQLGIGGLQPFEASTVYKTGFGDCKGLSNLMMAMLKSIDIPSNYCEIRMKGKKEFLKDFASVTQTNHVILLVPLKNDSIWLECTSQTIPFGYVHNDIAGHDALAITEEGGKICRLPSFTDKENKSSTNLTYSIKEDGSIEGNVSITDYLKYGLGASSRDDLIKYINAYLKLPQGKFGKVDIQENKSTYPSIVIEADFRSDNFANKTGLRLFVPACPIYKGNFNDFSASTRNLDIEFSVGQYECDTITMNIPELHVVESLPKDIDLETPFGSLKTRSIQTDNQIVYTQEIEMRSGKYDKSKYGEIKDFFNQIRSAINRKIVIKKQ